MKHIREMFTFMDFIVGFFKHILISFMGHYRWLYVKCEKLLCIL
jgi:hypothetical protein